MSAEPKRVELTEAEKVPLLQAYAAGPIAMLYAVQDIVAAREAAARREALLEAAEEMQAEKTMPFWSVHVAALRKRAALAEPERDEEGDMLGGAPGFKRHDATFPTDGEQPGPSDAWLRGHGYKRDEEGGND